MIQRILTLVSLTAVGMALGACADQNEDLRQPNAPSEGSTTTSSEDRTKWDAPTGDVGTARRKSDGQNCCYKDKFYKCGSPTACFGGVDLDACIAKCAGDTKCYTNTCTDQLRHAPAPTSDCVESQAPEGFSCSLY